MKDGPVEQYHTRVGKTKDGKVKIVEGLGLKEPLSVTSFLYEDLDLIRMSKEGLKLMQYRTTKILKHRLESVGTQYSYKLGKVPEFDNGRPRLNR